MEILEVMAHIGCDNLHVNDYIMAGHAIVVAKDITYVTLLFYHGNAVILTLW